MPEGPVRRVVPLAPDVTELAFAVGAGGLIVAAPPAADFPPEVARLPRVAPNDAEAILALRPDIVLATTAGNDPRVVQRLRQLGTRVCSMDVTSFARLGDACRLAGGVLGFEAEGEILGRKVDERVDRATARALALPKRNALYVVWWEPLIVAAPGTFHDDMLRRAGLANLAPGSVGRYPRVDLELLLDPLLQVVVAPDERDLHESYARTIGSAAGARLASGEVRVFWIPADLANRPGPRLPGALEALVAAREAEESQGSEDSGQGTRARGREAMSAAGSKTQSPATQGRSR
ncbi:MAG TPA: helical backbone metal receptor [Thermoanaerobaculaceae bacterium]|nr:helical backbone metal receptor [Thermoanaerobaculaceae bacterium]